MPGRVEKYVGTKFYSLCIDNLPLETNPRLKELIRWGKELQEIGVSPAYRSDGKIKGSYGNLGVILRGYDGIIVTPSASWLGELGVNDLVEVLGWNTIRDRDKPTVIYRGSRIPTSESIMYCLAFEKATDTKAIFHGHDRIVSRAVEAGLLSYPMTQEWHPYGTVGLAQEVAKIINLSDYLLIRDHHGARWHGILSKGRTMKDAGERALNIHNLAGKLLRENKVKDKKI